MCACVRACVSRFNPAGKGCPRTISTQGPTREPGSERNQSLAAFSDAVLPTCRGFTPETNTKPVVTTDEGWGLRKGLDTNRQPCFPLQ